MLTARSSARLETPMAKDLFDESTMTFGEHLEVLRREFDVLLASRGRCR